jgi:hypothetical protein
MDSGKLKDESVVGGPHVIVVASVAAQPGVPVYDAKIEAFRILVVLVKGFGGHCEAAIGCCPRRHN